MSGTNECALVRRDRRAKDIEGWITAFCLSHLRQSQAWGFNFQDVSVEEGVLIDNLRLAAIHVEYGNLISKFDLHAEYFDISTERYKKEFTSL